MLQQSKPEYLVLTSTLAKLNIGSYSYEYTLTKWVQSSSWKGSQILYLAKNSFMQLELTRVRE